MAASDYWNAFMQAAKRNSEENAAKQNAARAIVGASPINYDYNIIDFARDASPVGAAMNMGSALREGDYKKAGLNAALLGAEVLPVGKLAGPLAKRVYNAAVDSDYASLGDIFGKPASMPYRGVGAEANPLSNSEIKKILKEKQRLQKEYGDDVEISLHTSMADELDPNTYRYRSVKVPGKPGSGQGRMIFTHGLLDTEKYKSYGSNVHAVIFDKKGKTFSGPENIGDPKSRNETLIPEKDVIDIIRVLKREK